MNLYDHTFFLICLVLHLLIVLSQTLEYLHLVSFQLVSPHLKPLRLRRHRFRLCVFLIQPQLSATMLAISIVLTSFLAGIVAGVGEPGLPSCAGNCVSSFGGCQQLDVKCICSDSTLIANLACCVSTACDAADQESEPSNKIMLRTGPATDIPFPQKLSNLPTPSAPAKASVISRSPRRAPQVLLAPPARQQHHGLLPSRRAAPPLRLLRHPPLPRLCRHHSQAHRAAYCRLSLAPASRRRALKLVPAVRC